MHPRLERVKTLEDMSSLRLWLEVGERDNGATSASTGFHNWVIANVRMADVLKAKGYY